MSTTPDKNNHAPAFQLRDQHGSLFDSRSLKGRPWIAFFFPEAFTPSAYALALALRDRQHELGRLGVELVAVSTSSARRHAAFDRQHVLRIPLLSDPSGSLFRAFGAWREPALFGILPAAPRLGAVLVSAEGAIVAQTRGWRPRRIADEIVAAAHDRLRRAA